MDSFITDGPESPASSPMAVAFIVWNTPPIVIGAGSFLDRLAGLAGARNVFHDIATPSAQVSIETIAARNPDFIAVLSDTVAPPRYADRPEWRVVPSVRQRRVFFFAGGLVAGPRRPPPGAAPGRRRGLRRAARENPP